MKIKLFLPLALCMIAMLVLAGCTTSQISPINTTNASAANPDGKIYRSTDGTCKVINFMCTRGMKAFVDEKGCGCMPDNSSQEQPVDNGIQYVSTDLSQCQTIKYLCVRGKEPFTDDKGCGCRPISDVSGSDQQPNQFSCDATNIASAGNNPVCGWFNQSVQCIKYPCAINAPNASAACGTQNVQSYSMGVCPTQPANTLTSSQRMETKDPSVMCYELYQPVCAQFDDGVSKTISNICVADNLVGVVSTKPGACESANNSQSTVQGKRMVLACPSTYTQQQNSSSSVCTMEYSPVCASDASGTLKTYGNVCQACSTVGVFGYTQGECGPDSGAMK